VHRLALTAKGRAAVRAGAEIRAELNGELERALGAERAHTAARALRAALAAMAMGSGPAQDLSSAGR
jgi:hypothetical protein